MPIPFRGDKDLFFITKEPLRENFSLKVETLRRTRREKADIGTVHAKMNRSLDCIFKAKAIAVIGVEPPTIVESNEAGSVIEDPNANSQTQSTNIGLRIFLSIIENGYRGKVFPIVDPEKLKHQQKKNGAEKGTSPTPGSITVSGKEHQLYKSINDVPVKVDMAVFAICVRDGEAIRILVQQCGALGVGGLVFASVSSTRFRLPSIAFANSSESLSPPNSEDGNSVADDASYTSDMSATNVVKDILDTSREYGMRIIGPNCLGLLNPNLNLNVSLFHKKSMPRKGNIAFISQSGAMCSSILDWAQSQKVGFSHFVSVGSMIDVGFHDLIDYFGSDSYTSSILIYMESITNARKFVSAVRAFAKSKPIIVLKAGKTLTTTAFMSEQQTALTKLSHTHTLADNDAAFDAVFQRAGCIRVERISQLFNCAHSLSMQARPKGNKLAIVTNAGAPGVLSADRVYMRGGKLASLSQEAISKINQAMQLLSSSSKPNLCHQQPNLPCWSHCNPVHILGGASPQQYKAAVDACLQCEEVDGIVVILTLQNRTDAVGTARALVEANRRANKPILGCFMGEQDVWDARQILEEGKIPNYAFPESAVDVFLFMWQYTRNLQVLYETPPEAPPFERCRDRAWHIIRTALVNKRKCLLENEAKNLLSCYDLPVPKMKVATSPKDAAQCAMEIGFPLVMKVLSPHIIHKSDAGGVRLNITNRLEAENAYKDIMSSVKSHLPPGNIDNQVAGILMEKMYTKRYELLFGAKMDPVFGPVLVFGQGGLAVEVVRDYTTGLPPINIALAKRMIDHTKIYHQLKGFRNVPAIDINDLAFQLQKFSQIVMDFPEIEEIDVNPYLVDENGGVIVDASILLGDYRKRRRGHPYQHLMISPYPEKYTQIITAKNGRKVTLRAIRPEDEPIEHDMLASCSDESLAFRFMGQKPKLTHAFLTRLAQIDYDREMAIIAVVDEENSKKKMIAVARLIADAWGLAAEFAIIVTDQWQGQGLGSYMTDYILEIARDKSIKKVFASVLRENSSMTDMLKKRGFKMKMDPDDQSIVEATLDIEGSMPFIASDLPFLPE